MNEQAKISGFTLVEVMLAMSLSLVAIGGAVGLFTHASGLYRASIEARSLNETAYGALMAIRRDVEQIGFLGLADPDGVLLDAAPSVASALAGCGSDWAQWPAHSTGGTDNVYAWRCAAYPRSPMPGADTLLVRHVEPERANMLEAGRVYLESSADGSGRLLAPKKNASRDFGPLVTVNAIRMSGYYVSTSSAGSSEADTAPSLRAKRLSVRNDTPAMVDEEVQPGIEDMQIEFGIAAQSANQRSSATLRKFVSPQALAPTDTVLAVRIWLLARGTAWQGGRAASSVPAYADRPARIIADGYRRLLVSTTIATRHAFVH